LTHRSIAVRSIVIELVAASVVIAMLEGSSSVMADSEQAACGQLVRLGSALHLAGKKTTGAYKCQLQMVGQQYFIFTLKYSGREVVDGSSNLVGYYLVESGSGNIYEWDFSEEKPIGPILGLDTR
jgi:hypothetical protein